VMRAKGIVEAAVVESGLPATLLGPVYLMENLFNPWNLPALQEGRLPTPIPPRQSLQQAAAADVISLAALAIERPDEFVGSRIEIASDELTGEREAAALSTALGRSLTAEQLPRDGLPDGLRALFEWLESEPFAVDLEALRERFPEVAWHRFPTWAESEAGRLAHA